MYFNLKTSIGKNKSDLTKNECFHFAILNQSLKVCLLLVSFLFSVHDKVGHIINLTFYKSKISYGNGDSLSFIQTILVLCGQIKCTNKVPNTKPPNIEREISMS